MSIQKKVRTGAVVAVDRAGRICRVCHAGRAGADGAALPVRPGVAEAAAEQMEDGRHHRVGRRSERRHRLGIRPPERPDQHRARGRAQSPIADCCTLPPSMLHFDKEGTLIGSFAAPQGHGMDVDSKGFAYSGRTRSANTIRRPASWSARSSTRRRRKAAARSSRKRTCRTTCRARAARDPLRDSSRRLPEPRGRWRSRRQRADPAAQAAASAAFRAKYPPTTPMIVGGIEEIRVDEAANEIYVADNYLAGRVMVFDLTTLAVQARVGRVWSQADGNQRRTTKTTPIHRAVRCRRSLRAT